MNKRKPVQSDSQSLGDIGENHVQLILKKYKWTADLIKSDFGEDIDCNIFIDNLRTNYHLRCQVKSSAADSQYVKKLRNGDYSVSIDSNVLRAWLTSYFPVFLIIYEEHSELCYWCNPIEQILKTPYKLEKDKPSIRVFKKNTFDLSSKDAILDEVKMFYRKIQRLDESMIDCKILPVIMPGYRIIPFHDYSVLSTRSASFSSEISSEYLEALPSWMSVLKKIDPSSFLPFIKLKSVNTELDDFLIGLKEKLNSFNYSLKNEEWISFIVSPITIKSNNSSWKNELTYWISYVKLKNEIINDFEYNFEKPNGFLNQASRRARSWPFFHNVNPGKDIALQFFGCYEITPTIKKIHQIHDQSIKGQLLLWECNKGDIDLVIELLDQHELTIQIINDENPELLIAITTSMFDPFIGIYNTPMDWDSYLNGNVRNKLMLTNLIHTIPGAEYKGKVPEFLDNALNQYSIINYEKVLITDTEYIPGFPLKLEERLIEACRFQMITPDQVQHIEKHVEDFLKNTNHLMLQNYSFKFEMIDDSFGRTPIYQLSVSWTPELYKSSRQSYSEREKELLHFFNDLMPTNFNTSLQMKNSYEILHRAGEIGFETEEGY